MPLKITNWNLQFQLPKEMLIELIALLRVTERNHQKNLEKVKTIT